MLAFVFAIVIVLIGCDLCNFKFGTFEHVDLTNIPKLEADLAPCGEKDHSIIFEVCKNLSPSSCPSNETVGPGIGCDLFKSPHYPYWWWIGNAKNQTVSPYDKQSKSFVLKYFGVTQIQKSPKWRRDLELKMICDPMVKNATKCIGITQGDGFTVYQISVFSEHACPHWL